MAKIFAASLIAFILSSIDCACVQKGPCVCAFSEYSFIDLSQAVQDKNPKEPTFLEDGNGNITYYFHGCKDEIYHPPGNMTPPLKFKTSLLQHNVTLNATTPWESLGNSSQIKFEPATDAPNAHNLVYRHANGSVLVVIRLICDDLNTPFIKFIEDSGPISFALSSPHACIITHHPGLSTGSVLVILFFIASAIYLVGGALILYFIRGARGVELVPNVDFWRSLPGLVKDGIIFLFSGCSAVAISTPDSYDRI